MFLKMLFRHSPLCIALALSFPAIGYTAELEAFRAGNMSPVARIYGIPTPGSARTLNAGSTEAEVLLDVANNFTQSDSGQEQITLDSEMWQVTLGLRHGFTASTEVFIELPLLYQGGGMLDSFFEGWHSFFGLPQGGRDLAPRNRLLYSYRDEGNDRISFSDSGPGIGDLRLGGGYRVFQSTDGHSSAVIRASLKLPTGKSNALRGSGSTDLSLWITAAHSLSLSGGTVAGFASTGGIALTDGDLLPDRQRNFAIFGALGTGWSPMESLGFKIQVNAHSALYRSKLRELGQPTVQLLVGGTVAFTPATSLDIGLSEDLMTRTSSDAALHLGFVTRF